MNRQKNKDGTSPFDEKIYLLIIFVIEVLNISQRRIKLIISLIKIQYNCANDYTFAYYNRMKYENLQEYLQARS